MTAPWPSVVAAVTLPLKTLCIDAAFLDAIRERDARIGAGIAAVRESDNRHRCSDVHGVGPSHRERDAAAFAANQGMEVVLQVNAARERARGHG